MPYPMAMTEMSDYEVMEGIILNLKKFASREAFLEDLLETGTFEHQEVDP